MAGAVPVDAPEIPATVLWIEVSVALVSVDLGGVPVDGPETPESSETDVLETLETLVALVVVGTLVGAPVNPREISISVLLELLIGSTADFVVTDETPTRT